MKRLFENETPIEDVWTVLDLLASAWGDSTDREILRWDREGSYVSIGHHRDFSVSTYRYFRITEAVVERLLADRLVRGTPKWGYTEMRELTITESGEGLLWDTRKRMGMGHELRAERWLAEGWR